MAAHFGKEEEGEIETEGQSERNKEIKRERMKVCEREKHLHRSDSWW